MEIDLSGYPRSAVRAKLRSIGLAGINLICGIFFGIVILEAVFRVNPGLLFRGMALPAPVDRPLDRLEYDVRFSDADVFLWRPDLIRSIPAEGDKLEAHVVYETDELGFRNRPLIEENVDIVVLGRSVSLAGHLSEPWPTILGRDANLRVLNLSQPGGDLPQKIDYLERFGFPRRPKWVIVESIPSIDIIGGTKASYSLTREAVIPLMQAILRKIYPRSDHLDNGNEIFPLQVDLQHRSVNLTCCLHYMDFFSLNKEQIRASLDWKKYKDGLLDLVMKAKKAHACVILLYVPTKPDIYFPIVSRLQQLEPALSFSTSYFVAANGELVPEKNSPSVDTVRQNSNAGRELLLEFAREQSIGIIDPMAAMQESILKGEDPFMVYDSHWNALGHELVAYEAVQVLQTVECP